MRKLAACLSIALVLISIGCNSREVDDSGTTAKVKAKFVGDDQVSALKIAVSTSNGVVTLTGTVPTEVERDEAERDAASTDGVTRVVNNVVIDPNSIGATNAEAKANDKLHQIGNQVAQGATDDGIKAKIASKLLVAGVSGVKIDVSQGQVTLSGSVADARKKTEAEALASDTDGVKNVSDHLSVGN